MVSKFFIYCVDAMSDRMVDSLASRIIDLDHEHARFLKTAALDRWTFVIKCCFAQSGYI